MQIPKWRASGVALVSKSTFQVQNLSWRCKTVVLRLVWGGHAPPPLRRKNKGLRNADPVYVVLGLCVLGMGVHAPPWLRRKTMVLCPGHGGACPPLAATQNHGFVLRSEAGWPPSPQDKI